MIFPFMLSLTAMAAPSVHSMIYECFNSRFCATNLHTSIAKSINTSPYKEEPTRKHRSNSIRRDSKSGFLREMDIVNGFQLCDAKFKGSGTRGTIQSDFLTR